MKTQAEILHENITELSEKVDGFADAINTSLETVVDKTESIVVDLNQTYARLNEIDDTIANINTDVKVDVDLEELKEYIPEKTTQLVVEELSSKLDTLINAQKQVAIKEYGAINYYYSLIADRPEIVEFVNSLSSYETIEDKIEAIASIIENTNVSEILEGIELSQSSIDMMNICNDGTFGLKKIARFSPGADGNSEAVQDVLRQLLDAGKNEAAKLSDKITKDNICSVVADALRKLFNEKRKFAKNYTKNVHNAVESMLTELNKKCNDYYENHKDDIEDLVSNDDGPKPGCCTELNDINESIMQLLVVVANYPVFFKRPDLSFGECLTGENVDKVVRYWESDTNNVVTSNFPDTSNLKRLKNDVKAYIESLNEAVYDTVRCGGGNSEATWGTDANYIEQSGVYNQLKNPPNSNGTQTKCDSKEKISAFLNKWQTYIQNLHNGIHKEPITIKVLNDSAVRRSDADITFYMKKPATRTYEYSGTSRTDDLASKSLNGYDLVDIKNHCQHIVWLDDYPNPNTIIRQSNHTRSFDDMLNFLIKKAESGIVAGANNEKVELEKFRKYTSDKQYYHSWTYEVGYSVDILCVFDNEHIYNVLYHDFGAKDNSTFITQPENDIFGQFSDIYEKSFKKRIIEKIKDHIKIDCNEINDILNKKDPKYNPPIKADDVIAKIDDEYYTVSHTHVVSNQTGNYIYIIEGNKLTGPYFYTNDELTEEKWNEILKAFQDDYTGDFYILLAPKEKPTIYKKIGENKIFVLSWTIKPKSNIACIQLRENKDLVDDNCDSVEIQPETVSSMNSISFWEDIGTKNTFKSDKWDIFIDQIKKSEKEWLNSIQIPRSKNNKIYYYSGNVDRKDHGINYFCKPLNQYSDEIKKNHIYYYGIYLFVPQIDVAIEWRSVDKFCGGVKLWTDYQHNLIYDHIHCGGSVRVPYFNDKELNAEEYEKLTGITLKDAYDGKIAEIDLGPGELIDVSDNDEGVCYTLKVELPGGTGSFPDNIPALAGKTFEIKWKVVGGTNSKKLIEENGKQYAIVDLVSDTTNDYMSGKCTCNLDLELEEPEY